MTTSGWDECVWVNRQHCEPLREEEQTGPEPGVEDFTQGLFF
jgi:hypothetical protein